jgi:hypothetical protein
MSKFISEHAPEGFEPGAYQHGEIMHVHWERTEYYAEYVNPRLTLLKADEDDRVVGVQVWGMSSIEQMGEADVQEAPEEAPD